MSASPEPEILEPDDDHEDGVPMCDECCRDVGGEIVRCARDGRLTCINCDPTIIDDVELWQ